jgi:hypothetical protein
MMMNLHVTNDTYGLYPVEIAKRIKASQHREKNLMVNLSEVSQIRDEMISYISISETSFKNYIAQLPELKKIIFHPYKVNSFRFLTHALKRFPEARIYWVCWSFELYYHSKFKKKLYDRFSLTYLRKNDSFYKAVKRSPKKIVIDSLHFIGLRKDYSRRLISSYGKIDYFCSLLPSDFRVFSSLLQKQDTEYLPFSYLSLNNIVSGLNNSYSIGNKIMIGHSSSPAGNHYEIIEKLGSINREFSIFLPLAYGDKHYGKIIKNKAIATFKNIQVLEEKLEIEAYHQHLTQVGWAIINAKVQQGLGNILALIWIGAKLFLDKNSGTYQDFKTWGIIIFSVQEDLIKEQLLQRLTPAQIENNRKIILERFNEEQVHHYWEPLLS